MGRLGADKLCILGLNRLRSVPFMAIRVHAVFTGSGTLATSFASREDAELVADRLYDRGLTPIVGPLIPHGFYLYIPRMTPDELKGLSKDLGVELIEQRRDRGSRKACA